MGKRDGKDMTFLLLDDRSEPLASGRLESPPGTGVLQLCILEGKAEEVEQHKVIQLVGMGVAGTALECEFVRRRGDRIILQRRATLDPEFRRHLLVPVTFKTFLYPLDGGWKGRRNAVSVDLSCGGVAFHSTPGLLDGEQVEIVIPITEVPLVLRCQILHQNPTTEEDKTFYASKFVDMCPGEEAMVCEAVFNVELRGKRRRRKQRKEAVR
jgi:hypothetical protein